MIFVLIVLSISAIGLLTYLLIILVTQKPQPITISYSIIPDSQKLAVESPIQLNQKKPERYQYSDEVFEKLENYVLSSDLVNKCKIDIDENNYLVVSILPCFSMLRAWWESQGNHWISIEDMLNYTEEENHIAILRRHRAISVKYRSIIIETNRAVGHKAPIMSFKLLSKLQWMQAMGEPLPVMYQ